MSTFTSQQLFTLMSTISDSGLSSKQLIKKTKKVVTILGKKDPDFDKIISLFNSSIKVPRLKRAKNNWQLFLSEFREDLKMKNLENPGTIKISGAIQTQLASAAWKSMSDEEKKPFNDRAAELSVEYKSKILEIKKNCPIANLSDENSEKNEIDSDYSEENLQINSLPKKQRKPRKPIDLDFWDDSENLDFVRYTNNDESWEYAVFKNHFIIRESSDSKIFKIFTQEMKSEKAVMKSIAIRIEKKESENFEFADELSLSKSDLM